MPRYEITGPDGRTAIVEAPAGVTEQEATSFAQENWAGWVDGGRYAMEPASTDAPAAMTAGKAKVAQERGLVGEAAAGAARGITGTAASAGEGAIGLTALGPIYALAKRLRPDLSLQEFVHELNQEYFPKTREDMLGRGVGTAGEVAGGMIAGGAPTGGIARTAAGIAAPAIGGAVGEQLGESIGLPAWAGTVLGALLGGTTAPKPQRPRRAEKLAGMAETPARAQAVREMAERMPADKMPTPGQVRGEAGFVERAMRKTQAASFARQEKAGAKAVESLRQETMQPAAQPVRQAIGQTVLGDTEKVEAAVKRSTRPLFDAGDVKGVRIDLSPVVKQIDEVLEMDTAGAKRQLSSAERSDLQALRGELMPPPRAAVGDASELFLPPALAAERAAARAATTTEAVPGLSAGGTMDMISGNKARMRTVNPDGKAGTLYTSTIEKVNSIADDAYMSTIKPLEPKVAEGLKIARDRYREMMTTVYDDAVKKALRANPEDIGKLFWQTGNVSEIQQLQKLYAIAQREGQLTAQEVAKRNKDLTRAFLQEVTDSDSIARWSQTINERPLLRDTWNEMTKYPGGKELRGAMEVLEQAAQVSRTGTDLLVGFNVQPIQRAAIGGLGMSMTTGAVRPGWVAMGLSGIGVMKALTTMYTHGDKGMLNKFSAMVRAQQAGNPAAVKLIQEVYEWSKKNDAEDMFQFEKAEE